MNTVCICYEAAVAVFLLCIILKYIKKSNMYLKNTSGKISFDAIYSVMHKRTEKILLCPTCADCPDYLRFLGTSITIMITTTAIIIRQIMIPITEPVEPDAISSTALSAPLTTSLTPFSTSLTAPLSPP